MKTITDLINGDVSDYDIVKSIIESKALLYTPHERFGVYIDLKYALENIYANYINEHSRFNYTFHEYAEMMEKTLMANQDIISKWIQTGEFNIH